MRVPHLFRMSVHILYKLFQAYPENKMYLPFTFRPIQSLRLPSDYPNTTRRGKHYKYIWGSMLAIPKLIYVVKLTILLL